MNKKTETIYRIREFNRFYTTLVGMLDHNYLNSEYSVTEARILFELKNNDGCSANYLADKLHIDKSYLSRIIKGFKNKNLLSKNISEKDARAFNLILTDKGRDITNKLIEASNVQIGSLLASLTDDECDHICQAMDVITKFLFNGGKNIND